MAKNFCVSVLDGLNLSVNTVHIWPDGLQPHQ